MRETNISRAMLSYVLDEKSLKVINNWGFESFLKESNDIKLFWNPISIKLEENG